MSSLSMIQFPRGYYAPPAKACRDRGAERVFALATHGLLSEGARELFLPQDVDEIVVMDSVEPRQPAAEDIAGKLEILSCAKLLGDAIQRLHSARSPPSPWLAGVLVAQRD